MTTLPPAKRGPWNRLANKLTTHGGFSYPTPRSGVMVGRTGHEKVIEGKATPDQIQDYAKEHADVLQNTPEAHVGGWVHEGKTYLDISQRYPKGQQAEHAATANEELGAYDVRAQKTRPGQPSLFPLEPNVDPVFPKNRKPK